jgi:protein-S-isoprenylcysteine O-methyltransferase Ste14
MTLRELLEQQGDWFFRWRSYVPLVAIIFFALALKDFRYPWDSYRLYVIWSFFCLAVSLLGLGVRLLTAGFIPYGTSGLNTKAQAAVSLNTTGIYSVVRHPLYLGNFFIWLGVALFPATWWFVLLIAGLFGFFYERIMLAEERFLEEKFGDEFREWAAATPAFLPRMDHWRRAALTFSLKTAIKREYNAFFALVSGFYVLTLMGTVIAEGRLHFNPAWTLIFVAGAAIYLTIRYLKKKTDWLKVEGR